MFSTFGGLQPPYGTYALIPLNQRFEPATGQLLAQAFDDFGNQHQGRAVRMCFLSSDVILPIA
jgi:hypothetical protein